MIEKIRVSLWDLLTFFLSGLLFTLLLSIHMIWFDQITVAEFATGLKAMPATISVFVLPLCLTLLGMLIEPFANLFDKLILSRLWKETWSKKEKHKKDEKILMEEIRDNHLGSLNGKIENPYHICKEYVETKQLSTTFMVFLSRYGFYRNASFMCFFFLAVNLYVLGFCVQSIFVSAIWITLGFVFKKRAEDFYEFLAPNVYRCYLIDKILKTNGTASE